MNNQQLIKQCPKCKKEFECKQTDIINCQCATIELTEELRNYIRKHYSDCLCFDCLMHLKRLTDKSAF